MMVLRQAPKLGTEMIDYIRNKNRLWLRCHKKGYKTPAKARRALRRHGRSLGCVGFYLCQHHKPPVYHLTKHSRRISPTGEQHGQATHH